MAKHKKQSEPPTEIPAPDVNPEFVPQADPEEPVLPEEPDFIPDENPFETPPPYEIPPPGEGP